MDEVKQETRLNLNGRPLAASRKNIINVLWEGTQAFIAVSLTLAAIYSALTGGRETELLKHALFVVLGFYFGRTNHSRPTPSDSEGTYTVEGSNQHKH